MAGLDISNIYSLYANASIPCASIKINNSKCDFGKNTVVSSIDICCGVDAPSSRCIIEIKCAFGHFEKNKFKPGGEIDWLKPGNSIEVELGYSSSSKINICQKAFVGFISKAEVRYSRESVEVTIECMDTKIWMMAGRQNKKFKESKYSGIVKSVLSDNYQSTRKIKGSKIAITGEPKKLSQPVYQTNESDYEFLTKLANFTGSFFFIYLETAYFVSPGALKSGAALTVGSCKQLTDISWSVDPLGISQGVMFQGSSPDKEQKIPGNLVVKNLVNIGAGAQSPLAACAGNLGSYTNKKVSSVMIETVDEARFFSQAVYTKPTSKFVRCVLTLKGFTSQMVYPCMGVKVQDFGSPIDNSYIITEIRHKYDGIKKKFITYLTLSSDCYTPAVKSPL